MTDILGRLRVAGCGDCQRAADEIERLRAALKPFADAYAELLRAQKSTLSSPVAEDSILWLDIPDSDNHQLQLTMADFKRAAILNQQKVPE